MAAPDERIGRLVDDRYKILNSMAAGSMGAVYKAERVPVGKLVAIKFLHASFANDSEFLIRFERETQVMSKLAHPNCVSVVDFGVWEGSPYLVMDFVPGRTLRQIIDDGPIDIPRALLLGRQIAAGLAHAHTHEVVHRDVKPANIMVNDEIGTGERVRVLDFGLARLRGGGGRDATQTNVVVGTPNYMAPEQTIGGGTVDARTDVYATGVVLFEMIAGEKPFQAEETMQLLGMHRGAPIPRLADRLKAGGELPDGVQEVIDTAMAKRPDQRYQTAVELADALAAVIDGLVINAGGRPTGEMRIPASGVVKTPQAKSSSSTAIAPTMLDIGGESLMAATPGPKPWRKPLLGAVILFGGIAAGAGYLIHRSANQRDDAMIASGAGGGSNGQVDSAIGQPDTVLGAGSDQALVGSASDGSAAGSNDPGVGSGSADVGSGGSDAESGSNTGSDGSDGSGAGSGSEDIEMDPVKALDPNPSPEAANAVDEASDAPTTADVEKRTPVHAQPTLAKTIPGAVQQIKAGQRDLALSSLIALRRSNPKSAYIPFLLGSLYFDKMWWGVALDHYKAAIAINGGYRKNQILNQNVIRMLASKKTQRSAQSVLRFTIGRSSVPFLKYAAAHETNPVIKKQAAQLAKSIR